MQVTTRDLETHYDLSGAAVDPLSDSTRAWRVRADQGDFVLRLFNSVTVDERRAEIDVLGFLEASSFPAARVLPSREGESLIVMGKTCGYLTSYIPGETPSASPESARDLGRIAGRLHSLDTASHDLQPTAFTVSAERELFRQLDADPSVQRWEGYEAVRKLLQTSWESISDLDSVPNALVHTDILYENAVQAPDGDMVLIDWDGAGIGPAVQDVGYSLLNHTVSIEGQLLPPESSVGFLKAYLDERPLDSSEWDALSDALVFASIVYVLAPWAARVSTETWRRAEYTIAHAEELRDCLQEASLR